MTLMTQIGSAMISLACLGQAASVHEVDPAIVSFQEAVERLNRCSFEYEREWYRQKAKDTRETLIHIRRGRVLLDRTRWKWNYLVYDESHNPEPVGKFVNEVNFISDQQLLEIYCPRQQVDVRPSEPMAAHGYLNPSPSDRMKIQNYLGEAMFAFGFLKFESLVPFSQLLKDRSAVPKIERNSKGESEIFVDTRTTDGGQIRIWINPEKNHLPSGMRLERTDTSVFENRSKELKQYLETDFGIPSDVPIKSVTYEVRNVTFAPWQDTHVITSFEALHTITAENGAKAVDRQEVRFSDWNLAPDVSSSEAFRPLLPIPEGFRVEAQDEPSIQYVYRNGKIEKDVNESTVAGLGKVTLPPRRVAARVQWGWFAVAGVLAFLWWRIRVTSAR